MTTDKAHLTNLIDKLGHPPKEATFDDDGRLIILDLSELGLRELPPEIGRLRHLQELDVSGNRLDSLSDELAEL